MHGFRVLHTLKTRVHDRNGTHYVHGILVDPKRVTQISAILGSFLGPFLGRRKGPRGSETVQRRGHITDSFDHVCPRTSRIGQPRVHFVKHSKKLHGDVGGQKWVGTVWGHFLASQTAAPEPRFAKRHAKSQSAPSSYDLKPSMHLLRRSQPPSASKMKSGDHAVV